MDPRDPHSNDSLDDTLDTLLAEQSHVDDAGFADAVMRNLPKPRRRLRGLIIGSASVASVLVVASSPHVSAVVSKAAEAVLADGMLSAAGLLTLAATTLAAVWAAAEA